MMNERRAESHCVDLINIQLHIWVIIDAAGEQQGAMLNLSWCFTEQKQRNNFLNFRFVLHKITTYKIIMFYLNAV